MSRGAFVCVYTCRRGASCRTRWTRFFAKFTRATDGKESAWTRSEPTQRRKGCGNDDGLVESYRCYALWIQVNKSTDTFGPWLCRNDGDTPNTPRVISVRSRCFRTTAPSEFNSRPPEAKSRVDWRIITGTGLGYPPPSQGNRFHRRLPHVYTIFVFAHKQAYPLDETFMSLDISKRKNRSSAICIKQYIGIDFSIK